MTTGAHYGHNQIDVASAISITRDEPSFSFIAIDVSVENNKSMFSLLNTSATKVKIRNIHLINSQTTAVTGQIAEFRILRITNHSGGTVITGQSFDTNDTLPGSLTARTNATLTGLGTIPFKRAKWSTDEWGVGAEDVESLDHTMHQLFPWYQYRPGTKPITLNLNEGISIQQVVNTNVGSFTILCEVSL